MKRSRLELCVACKTSQARIRGLENERGEYVRTIARLRESLEEQRDVRRMLADSEKKLRAAEQKVVNLEAAYRNARGITMVETVMKGLDE